MNRVCLQLLGLLLLLVATPSVAMSPNTLSAEEEAAGWMLLFDGQSFQGWKNYGAEPGAPIRGWEVQDGSLAMVRDTTLLGLIWNAASPLSDGILDLMTERRFRNFELQIDWKISHGGNSGIFYLVPDESTALAWDLAVEMQVLDNDNHRDGQIVKHRAGDLYDLKASSSEPVRPVGEWNQARIRVEGDRLRHWLNGVVIVDVLRTGPEWDALLTESKFSDTEGYAQAKLGHLVLQDHGDPVWYRNIKIRELEDGNGDRAATPDSERQ